MTVVEASPGWRYRVGDLFVLDGVEVGRVEEVEGNLLGKVTVRLVPSLLYFALLVEWWAKIEQRPRHLTAEPMPCHDPPVAWRDARLGQLVQLIVCPALNRGDYIRIIRNPKALPIVLDKEPGRR